MKSLAQVDPEQRVRFLDRLSEETELPDPGAVDGLPESLAEALGQWLEEKADVDDVAEWLAEPPVEVIERQMRNEVGAARADVYWWRAAPERTAGHAGGRRGSGIRVAARMHGDQRLQAQLLSRPRRVTPGAAWPSSSGRKC